MTKILSLAGLCVFAASVQTLAADRLTTPPRRAEARVRTAGQPLGAPQDAGG